jgi:hypothetical protein
MVYYSKNSQQDFVRLFKELLNWKTKNNEYRMTYEEVVNYRSDLYEQCLSIDKLNYREKPRYADHSKFGQFVFSYERNSRTTWYIIYDVKLNGDIQIKKITNNHKTIS